MSHHVLTWQEQVLRIIQNRGGGGLQDIPAHTCFVSVTVWFPSFRTWLLTVRPINQQSILGILFLVGEQLHITALIVIIGVPAYRLLVCVCPKYLPNMLKWIGIGLPCCFIKTVAEIIIHSMWIPMQACRLHFHIKRSQFLSINETCSNISQLTNHKFFSHETNNFLVYLFPNSLQGFLVLLVFMTALEFAWAQASLRLKGLLIGIWYTS